MQRAFFPSSDLTSVSKNKKTGAAYKYSPARPRSPSPAFPPTFLCVGGDPSSLPGPRLLPDRSPSGETATAVSAIKGGKVVGIVVTNTGSGYADVSFPIGTGTRGKVAILAVLV